MVAIKAQDAKEGADELKMLEALATLEVCDYCDAPCSVATCLIDTVEEEGILFTVMELLENARDLEQVLKVVERLPRNDATRWIRCEYIARMMYSIQILHEYGIFHRDIKPENFISGETTPGTIQDFRDAWLAIAEMRDGLVIDLSNTQTALEQYAELRLATRNVDNDDEVAFVKEFVLGNDNFIVKTIDFGLSTEACGSFNDGYAGGSGTILYIDPWYYRSLREQTTKQPIGMFDFYDVALPGSEACAREAMIWKMVDTWAMGVAAYTMFWGFLPFEFTKSEQDQGSDRRASEVQAYMTESLVGSLRPPVGDQLKEQFAGAYDVSLFAAAMSELALEGKLPRRGALDVEDPDNIPLADIQITTDDITTEENDLDQLEIQLAFAKQAFEALEDEGDWEELEEAETEVERLESAVMSQKMVLSFVRKQYRKVTAIYWDSYVITAIEELLQIYPPDRTTDLRSVKNELEKRLELVNN